MAMDVKQFYDYVLSVEGKDQNFIAMGHSLGTYIWINSLISFKYITLDALVLISGGSINNEIPHSFIIEKHSFSIHSTSMINENYS